MVGFKTTCNLQSGKVYMPAGAQYAGAKEDIEQLLKDGLIIEDNSVSEPSQPLKNEIIEERPKKSKSRVK